MDKAMLSRAEIAEYLGVSTGTVNSMMKEGLPHFKTGEARSCKTLFPRAAVDSWIAERVAKSLHPSNQKTAPDVVRKRPRRRIG